MSGKILRGIGRHADGVLSEWLDRSDLNALIFGSQIQPQITSFSGSTVY